VVGRSGTPTFLFTDIEGSTRRWERDPEAMESALATHDEVLRSAIEVNGGRLFKHTGDGVCAAFASARSALDAAVEAQRRLALPVRMGVASGEAEERGGDFFGPPLNRAARVMAAGHGGQILVAASTAALVDGVDFLDLGEHRLRDLSQATRVFQVRAPGLALDFPQLTTVDAVPGNLPVQVTSFVGRDVEVKEVAEQVRTHRLVTLTGVGGVGKTRLAVQVAGELVAEFPDGVWLVELAPVGDAGAVSDVVATVLGVPPQAGRTVTDGVVQALSGRRLLLVVDNCEHVLVAAGDLIDAIVTRTTTVTVLATSREGLRVPAEQLWPVPSLDVAGSIDSSSVRLFVERARAVRPNFASQGDEDGEAMVDICRRVDGIALAIELAAARVVSMSAQDVCDHLHDRFRLLAGSRRGLERHQTLRNTVQWSYDLLADDERAVLDRCSVFAGGFDLAAATNVSGADSDQLELLDRLDSLVRKSLVTVEQIGGHVRYGMLETIRQFAEERLAASGTSAHVRDRHATYFAREATARWEMWEGPGYRRAVDWVDVEFANLRVAFRWAADRGDIASAAAIAAHTTMMAWTLELYEPTTWAEEILPAAEAADLLQLPRVYSAASLCFYTGRVEEATAHARAAVALQDRPGYDPFDPGWTRSWAATIHHYTSDDLESVDAYRDLAGQSGLARVSGLGLLMGALIRAGRPEQARAIADEALIVARVHGNPMYTALALINGGHAFAGSDHARALEMFREAITIAQDERIPIFEHRVTFELAHLELLHGEPATGLGLFDRVIDANRRTGNQADVPMVFAALATYFERQGRPDVAASLHGLTTGYPGSAGIVADRSATVDRLRSALGSERFERLVAEAAELEFAGAVRYARDQIRAVLGATTARPPP
jgi:predicted ATPase